jgi:gliding motility-associated lipoprotein GldD
MKINYILFLSFILLISACNQNYSPKPRGYFRIDLPEKSYVKFDSTFPFSFEYPKYATIIKDPYSQNEKYWINLEMYDFDATLHFSYKKVNGNLVKYLEDSHTLVSKHIPKADAIYDSIIIDRQRNVFGLSYQIIGSDAASPFQFFLTDSSTHFLRGALYFNSIPNNDSMQPVIDFIAKDIDHIINTLEWNEIPNDN